MCLEHVKMKAISAASFIKMSNKHVLKALVHIWHNCRQEPVKGFFACTLLVYEKKDKQDKVCTFMSKKVVIRAKSFRFVDKRRFFGAGRWEKYVLEHIWLSCSRVVRQQRGKGCENYLNEVISPVPSFPLRKECHSLKGWNLCEIISFLFFEKLWQLHFEVGLLRKSRSLC